MSLSLIRTYVYRLQLGDGLTSFTYQYHNVQTVITNLVTFGIDKMRGGDFGNLIKNKIIVVSTSIYLLVDMLGGFS